MLREISAQPSDRAAPATLRYKLWNILTTHAHQHTHREEKAYGNIFNNINIISPA